MAAAAELGWSRAGLVYAGADEGAAQEAKAAVLAAARRKGLCISNAELITGGDWDTVASCG